MSVYTELFTLNSKKLCYKKYVGQNIIMGVNPGGDGGDASILDASPQFLEWGGQISNYPPLFNMFNEILFLGNLKT